MVSFNQSDTHAYYAVVTLVWIFFKRSFLSRFVIIVFRSSNDSKSHVYLYCVFYTLLLVTFYLPMYAFLQREYLLFIFIMPYLLLAALRIENKSIHPLASFFIGLFAGLGFAIKPFFLVTLVLVELCVMIKTRNFFSWLRIEPFVIASVLVVYLISVFSY